MVDLSPIQEFLEHLKGSRAQDLMARADELRSRLLRTTAVVFAVFIVCFVFAQKIFVWLKHPLMEAMPKGGDLHFLGPMEVFICYVKVSFLIAACVSAPYAFWQVWKFIGPALPETARRFVKPFFIASLILFAAGVVFCYVAMLPVTLEFLVGMADGLAVPLLSVDDYVDLVVFMLLAFGAAFQLPLAIIILEMLGIITVEMLTKNRRAIFLVILVIAAVVTPTPDPLTMMAMATPMYLMFEAAILVIKWTSRKRQAAQSSSLISP